MSVIGSNILAGASGQGGYFLTNSLRFRSSASAYLSRTPSVSGNRRTWTWSSWVKRGTLGSAFQSLFAASNGSTVQFYFGFANDQLAALNWASVTQMQLNTTPVYRDPSAWYHIVLAVDTTQATSTNRIKFYVNGVEITSFGTASYPAQNLDIAVNALVPHAIGREEYSDNQWFDGYLAETHFIDGQQLTPSSFGETSTSTGVWIPKKFVGTYGTNGFYLPFTDNSALTTSSNVGLGKDFSGNANYFATNNISLTAGTTYDSMTDVPTLTSATAANYCVLNPLDIFYNTATTTVTNGNLTFTASATSGGASVRASMALTSGKFYYEAVLTSSITSSSTQTAWGIATSSYASSWGGAGSWGIVLNDSSIRARRIFNQGTTTNITDNTNVTATAILQCFVDTSTGNAWFGINNTWYDSSGGTTGNPSAGTNPTVTSVSGTVFPYLWAYGQNPSINFGQRPFSYTPPTGFVALNTFNLPTPTIGATASTLASKNMNIALYTGTGSSQSITGLGFQPDWTWIKERNAAADHGLYDAVRGVQKQLESNTTTAETTETTGLTAFGSDGFTVGALAQLNTSADTYVAWNWKANGAGVTNTAGSITSTVSANTTSGFSIVTWAGNSTNAATIGHGLGVAPSILITKSRTNASSWVVGIGGMSGFGINDYLVLQSTAAKGTSSTFYQAYGSSTFTVGVSAADEMNKTGNNYVTYCFAQVAGYSAFGSYTGNGSADGPFVFTGFRPRFLMIKATASESNADWLLYDSARNTYNAMNTRLWANLSAAETSDSAYLLDFVSNGFKIRTGTANVGYNNNGGNYIYMAFAENPFKYANAR